MKKTGNEFVRLKRNSIVTREKEVKHYVLGETLGEGSFGKVKEAYDRRNRRLCAIKIVKKQNLNKAAGEENIQKEVEILRKLHHINCLHLFDFFTNEEKHKVYIVCELASGGSVKQLCDRAPSRRLPLLQARNLFVQLLDAMEYLHSLNIFHRDLKPDNMLLTPDGVLKVSDFGVALFLENNVIPPGSEKCKGSPAFQPPEIIGEQCIFSGSKIDIWSAGITLYMMCTGTYPFEGTSMRCLFESISQCHYVIPNWIDPSLTDLLHSILNKDYKKRFTIEEIRMHPWMNSRLKKEKFVPIITTPTSFKEEDQQTCGCTIL